MWNIFPRYAICETSFSYVVSFRRTHVSNSFLTGICHKTLKTVTEGVLLWTQAWEIRPWRGCRAVGLNLETGQPSNYYIAALLLKPWQTNPNERCLKREVLLDGGRSWITPRISYSVLLWTYSYVWLLCVDSLWFSGLRISLCTSNLLSYTVNYKLVCHCIFLIVYYVLGILRWLAYFLIIFLSFLKEFSADIIGKCIV